MKPVYDNGLGVEILDYLEVFLDFGYYFGVIPFRVTKTPLKQYELVQHKFQKALSYILAIIRLYNSAVIKTLQDLKNDNQLTAIFSNAQILLYIFTEVLCTLTFHLRKKQFLAIFQGFQTHFPTNSEQRKTEKWRARNICIIFLFLTLMSNLSFLHEQNWKLKGLDFYPVESNSSEKLAINFLDLCVIIIVLMQFNLAQCFSSYLKVWNRNADQVINMYDKLKEFIKLINDACGIPIFTFIMSDSPFLINNLSKSTSFEGNLRMLFYTTYFFGTLWVSAAANYKITELRSWIHNNRDQLDLDMKSSTKIVIILNELTPYSPVGLSTLNGLFILNFNLFFSILSILVAYVLVMMQYAPT